VTVVAGRRSSVGRSVRAVDGRGVRTWVDRHGFHLDAHHVRLDRLDGRLGLAGKRRLVAVAPESGDLVGEPAAAVGPRVAAICSRASRVRKVSSSSLKAELMLCTNACDEWLRAVIFVFGV